MFASLVNPLIITVLVLFCGVLSPPDQITPVWVSSLDRFGVRSLLYLITFVSFANKLLFQEGLALLFKSLSFPDGCTFNLASFASSVDAKNRHF